MFDYVIVIPYISLDIKSSLLQTTSLSLSFLFSISFTMSSLPTGFYEDVLYYIMLWKITLSSPIFFYLVILSYYYNLSSWVWVQRRHQPFFQGGRLVFKLGSILKVIEFNNLFLPHLKKTPLGVIIQFR